MHSSHVIFIIYYALLDVVHFINWSCLCNDFRVPCWDNSLLSIEVTSWYNVFTYFVDTNGCAADNGQCSHLCLNTPISYTCACPMGMELGGDNKTCIHPDAFLLFSQQKVITYWREKVYFQGSAEFDVLWDVHNYWQAVVCYCSVTEMMAREPSRIVQIF